MTGEKGKTQEEKRTTRTYPKAEVTWLKSDIIEINGQAFTLEVDEGGALKEDELAQRYMPMFDQYDYIVGDWSYEQLRLRGFYEDHIPNTYIDQRISYLNDYINEFCAYGCKYFVLYHQRSEIEIKNRNEMLRWQKQELKAKTQKKKKATSVNKKRHSRKKTRQEFKKQKIRQQTLFADFFPDENQSGARRTVTSGLKGNKQSFNIKKKGEA